MAYITLPIAKSARHSNHVACWPKARTAKLGQSAMCILHPVARNERQADRPLAGTEDLLSSDSVA